MAIQFACPGCQQPIEVDDEWAQRQVACPYCRRTITAPAASMIQRLSPPAARPLGQAEPDPSSAESGSAAAPLSGPPGAAVREGNPYAVWALEASIFAVLCLLSMSVLAVIQVAGTIGPGNSPDEMQESFAELQKQWLDEAQKGKMPPALLMIGLGMCAMVVTWATGLVLTVLALRRRARRGISIAALVINALLALYMCISLFAQL